MIISPVSAAAKDRPYRCLDRISVHKDDLCRRLTQCWKTLFDALFNLLLYDLSGAYFEGLSAADSCRP